MLMFKLKRRIKRENGINFLIMIYVADKHVVQECGEWEMRVTTKYSHSKISSRKQHILEKLF